MKTMMMIAALFATSLMMTTGCATHSGSNSMAATKCNGSCCSDPAKCAACCGDKAGCEKCCKM